MVRALQALGVRIQLDPETKEIAVTGCAGIFPQAQARLFCEEAGTVARFLLVACANQLGDFLFEASPRLCARPLQALVRVLQSQGVDISADTLPLRMRSSGALLGGNLFIQGDVSSQFLSGLLMMAPYFQQDTIFSTKNLVSQPYVTMTCTMMHAFGVTVMPVWRVAAGQRYQARTYWIESDFSSASYFFAAAAVTGSTITVTHLALAESMQGDRVFLNILETMGCTLEITAQAIRVSGPTQLRGVTVDMADMSDTMMTLAAIAPFADSPTCIRNIGHTRVKESDRIQAMTQNLQRLGIRIDEEATQLTIYPGRPRAAPVSSYGDHRIAMACALLGLKISGLSIDNICCVHKTFPEFFEQFNACFI